MLPRMNKLTCFGRNENLVYRMIYWLTLINLGGVSQVQATIGCHLACFVVEVMERPPAREHGVIIVRRLHEFPLGRRQMDCIIVIFILLQHRRQKKPVNYHIWPG